MFEKFFGEKRPVDPVSDIARAYGFDQYIDREPPSGLAGEIWRANRKKAARALLTSGEYALVPENLRRELVSRMGFDDEDMDYMRLVSIKRTAGNAAVAPLVAERIKTAGNYDETVNRMLDEKLLTLPLIKEMYAEGLIDDNLYYALRTAKKYGGKSVGTKKYIRSGKTSSSRGRGGRVPAKKSAASEDDKGTMSVLEKYFADLIVPTKGADLIAPVRLSASPIPSPLSALRAGSGRLGLRGRVRKPKIRSSIRAKA
ncbi:MAG TPA: hypothetical protein ENJ77_00160 [Candidatus Moranbacteria bacterium]|nr:hypothetical protein [Candidatus Moranbacteria bacterium]